MKNLKITSALLRKLKSSKSHNLYLAKALVYWIRIDYLNTREALERFLSTITQLEALTSIKPKGFTYQNLSVLWQLSKRKVPLERPR